MTSPPTPDATTADATAAYAYVPFAKPMPVWDYWPALILPLVIAIAVVHKSVKCRTMREVPREAAVITAMILAGLGAVALLLALVVRLSERGL